MSFLAFIEIFIKTNKLLGEAVFCYTGKEQDERESWQIQGQGKVVGWAESCADPEDVDSKLLENLSNKLSIRTASDYRRV